MRTVTLGSLDSELRKEAWAAYDQRAHIIHVIFGIDVPERDEEYRRTHEPDSSFNCNIRKLAEAAVQRKLKAHSHRDHYGD